MCFLNCNTKYNANSGMIFFSPQKQVADKKLKKKKKAKVQELITVAWWID